MPFFRWMKLFEILDPVFFYMEFVFLGLKIGLIFRELAPIHVLIAIGTF
jgi:hypothetical protein